MFGYCPVIKRVCGFLGRLGEDLVCGMTGQPIGDPAQFYQLPLSRLKKVCPPLYKQKQREERAQA